MSVSMLVFKGEFNDLEKSECLKDIPVSFFQVWMDVWRKAIAECKIKKFACGGTFRVNEIPTVLQQLDAVYDWVGLNGGDDTEYVQRRIRELKEYLNEYYNESDNSDYWFDLG